MHYRKRLT